MEDAVEFETKSMGKVYIQDEIGELVIRTPDGQIIGNVSYRQIEGPDERFSDDEHLITNIYIDGPNKSKAYLRQGIGRKCMQILNEYGYTVTARQHFGNVLDDGSHLTENAPGFFNKMVEEGLVFWTD